MLNNKIIENSPYPSKCVDPLVPEMLLMQQ